MSSDDESIQFQEDATDATESIQYQESDSESIQFYQESEATSLRSGVRGSFAKPPGNWFFDAKAGGGAGGAQGRTLTVPGVPIVQSTGVSASASPVPPSAQQQPGPQLNLDPPEVSVENRPAAARSSSGADSLGGGAGGGTIGTKKKSVVESILRTRGDSVQRKLGTGGVKVGVATAAAAAAAAAAQNRSAASVRSPSPSSSAGSSGAPPIAAASPVATTGNRATVGAATPTGAMSSAAPFRGGITSSSPLGAPSPGVVANAAADAAAAGYDSSDNGGGSDDDDADAVAGNGHRRAGVKDASPAAYDPTVRRSLKGDTFTDGDGGHDADSQEQQDEEGNHHGGAGAVGRPPVAQGSALQDQRPPPLSRNDSYAPPPNAVPGHRRGTQPPTPTNGSGNALTAMQLQQGSGGALAPPPIVHTRTGTNTSVASAGRALRLEEANLAKQRDAAAAILQHVEEQHRMLEEKLQRHEAQNSQRQQPPTHPRNAAGSVPHLALANLSHASLTVEPSPVYGAAAGGVGEREASPPVSARGGALSTELVRARSLTEMCRHYNQLQVAEIERVDAELYAARSELESLQHDLKVQAEKARVEAAAKARAAEAVAEAKARQRAASAHTATPRDPAAAAGGNAVGGGKAYAARRNPALPSTASEPPVSLAPPPPPPPSAPAAQRTRDIDFPSKSSVAAPSRLAERGSAQKSRRIPDGNGGGGVKAEPPLISVIARSFGIALTRKQRAGEEPIGPGPLFFENGVALTALQTVQFLNAVAEQQQQQAAQQRQQQMNESKSSDHHQRAEKRPVTYTGLLSAAARGLTDAPDHFENGPVGLRLAAVEAAAAAPAPGAENSPSRFRGTAVSCEAADTGNKLPKAGKSGHSRTAVMRHVFALLDRQQRGYVRAVDLAELTDLLRETLRAPELVAAVPNGVGGGPIVLVGNGALSAKKRHESAVTNGVGCLGQLSALGGGGALRLRMLCEFCVDHAIPALATSGFDELDFATMSMLLLRRGDVKIADAVKVLTAV